MRRRLKNGTAESPEEYPVVNNPPPMTALLS